MSKAVVLLSGGLDSTTLAYYLKDQTYDLHTLAFDYGQRHRKELVVAEQIAKELGATHHTIRLQTLTENRVLPFAEVLPGSSLTDATVEVPEGHYAADSMKSTVVPNRNAIMLSIAYGVGVADKARVVAFAAHAGDHAIYPDCRPQFVANLELALRQGNAWTPRDYITIPDLLAPFIHLTKTDIAVKAVKLGVPIARTWSCYKGEQLHCGRCGTCYERREALRGVRNFLPGYEDPTLYLDSTIEYEAPEHVE